MADAIAVFLDMPDLGDLIEWVDCCWPLIADNPEPALWAREYRAACRGRRTVLR
jgi:hypothetical protein